MSRGQLKRERVKAAGGDTLPVSVLGGLLHSYERYCSQTDSGVSAVLKQDILLNIERQKLITKITVTLPDSCANDVPPTLRPLLLAIRTERYTHTRELCVWDLTLTHQDITELYCLLLEKRDGTEYPLRQLELLDCKLDDWSLEQLGRVTRISSLTKLCLDYTFMGEDGLRGLLCGIDGSCHVLSLSLCYCGLGQWSGSMLASMVAQSTVRELYVSGNELQCGGATELVQVLAVYAEQTAKTQLAATHFTERKKKKVKNKKKEKKKKSLVEAGPWLEKLHMFDNLIDDAGTTGSDGLLNFTQLICVLVRFSGHLIELDIGNNHIGENSGKLLLEAFRDRKAAKLLPVRVRVTPRMSTEKFTSILKCAKELKSAKKKRHKKIPQEM